MIWMPALIVSDVTDWNWVSLLILPFAVTPASPLSNGSRARNMHTKSNGSGRTRERYCEDCQVQLTHSHSSCVLTDLFLLRLYFIRRMATISMSVR